MARAGRTPKLSPAVTARVVASLQNGDDWDVAARLAGIDPSTLHRWRARGRDTAKGIYREFLDTVEKARAEAIARNNFIVQQAGLGVERVKTVTRTFVQNGQMVTETTVTKEREFDWRASAWWIEKHVLAPQLAKAAKDRAGAGGDADKTSEDVARDILAAIERMDSMSAQKYDNSDATSIDDLGS